MKKVMTPVKLTDVDYVNLVRNITYLKIANV